MIRVSLTAGSRLEQCQLLLVVGFHVFVQIALVSRRVDTELTLVGLFSRVRSDMLGEILLISG